MNELNALGYATCLDARGYYAEASELRRQHSEIERLNAENFALAAVQCVNATADEGGRPYCAEIAAIRNLLPDDLFPGSKDWTQGELAQRVDCLKGWLASERAYIDQADKALERVVAEREALKAFVLEVRRTGDTRLASMAIATLAFVGELP